MKCEEQQQQQQQHQEKVQREGATLRAELNSFHAREQSEQSSKARGTEANYDVSLQCAQLREYLQNLREEQFHANEQRENVKRMEMEQLHANEQRESVKRLAMELFHASEQRDNARRMETRR